LDVIVEEGTFNLSINNNNRPPQEQDTQYWECAEVLIFDSVLKSGEINKIKSYLYHKYFSQPGDNPGQGILSSENIFTRNNVVLSNSDSDLSFECDNCPGTQLDSDNSSVYYRKILPRGDDAAAGDDNAIRKPGVRVFIDGEEQDSKYYTSNYDGEDTVNGPQSLLIKKVTTSKECVSDETDPYKVKKELYSLDTDGNIHVCRITD